MPYLPNVKLCLLCCILLLTACESSKRLVSTSTERLNVALASLEPQQFVPGIEDLPLYNGFRPKGTKNTVYTSDNERIIELTYYSHLTSKGEVESYYQTALEQLGWQQTKKNQYIRKNESLTLAVSSRDGVTMLYLYLTPLDK